MRLYAKPGSLLAKQLLSDFGVVVWAIGWLLLANLVRGYIEQLAEPALRTAESAREISRSLGDAGEDVSNLPLVGGALQGTFDTLSGTLSEITTSSELLAEQIHTLALVIAVVVFALPVVYYLVKWVPWRLHFMAESRHAVKLLRMPSALDFYALRALAQAPLAELEAVGGDPVKDWREGNYETIRKLAKVGLARHGIGLSKASRESGGWTKGGKAAADADATEFADATWDNLRNKSGRQ
ncbi:MAG: hypothetical protein LBR58_06360 [Propionibacteriaceae bacterium]|jgi:hypothetical protein|nr:hypothetical protein [Propionibacteriaceae bacterium]